MLATVDQVRATQPRVGTRKLQRHLADVGVRVGRDQLFADLRTSGRLVRRKRRHTRTTYARHAYVVAPNRVRGVPVTAPRHVLVSDLTYLCLASAAFAYLFLVTDRYARRIVGWHLSRDASHRAALQALTHAISTLGEVTGVVHHSDRGSQYCCHAYRDTLAQHHMLASMTDADHCYQNAVAERVNGILKDEFDLDAVFSTFADAQQAVARAIATYNHVRLHSSLQWRTPDSVFTTHAA